VRLAIVLIDLTFYKRKDLTTILSSFYFAGIQAIKSLGPKCYMFGMYTFIHISKYTFNVSLSFYRCSTLSLSLSLVLYTRYYCIVYCSVLAASYGFIDSSSTEGRNASYPTLYPLPFFCCTILQYSKVQTCSVNTL
jgi:hypothetical protein